jgi:glycosyltransferase involved in cell wall biosynthesis
MKAVSDLYKRLQDPEFCKSQFEFSEEKRNILFIDPIMSNFDFYSMIIPYLSLEELGSYKTAMTGMYRYSDYDTKPLTKISQSQIKWADVIVVPMSLESYSGDGELFSEIRSINPDVKIVQTVEFDFYEIKNDHYLLDLQNLKTPALKSRMKESIISRLESNLKSADRLIVLNHNLAPKLMKMGYNDVKVIPILIEEQSFKENIDFMDTLGLKNTVNIVFLSMELNQNTRSSFKEFIPVLKEIKKKHDKLFRIVIIGENPIKMFPNFDVEFDFIQKGSIVNQFKTINRSSADIHLVLNKKNEYSTNSETLFSFIENGLFGIPVVTLEVSPLKDVIKDGSNGFILKNRNGLSKLVDELMIDKTTLIAMSNILKTSIINNSQISTENLTKLGESFFDNYKNEQNEQ